MGIAPAGRKNRNAREKVYTDPQAAMADDLKSPGGSDGAAPSLEQGRPGGLRPIGWSFTPNCAVWPVTIWPMSGRTTRCKRPRWCMRRICGWPISTTSNGKSRSLLRHLGASDAARAGQFRALAGTPQAGRDSRSSVSGRVCRSGAPQTTGSWRWTTRSTRWHWRMRANAGL